MSSADLSGYGSSLMLVHRCKELNNFVFLPFQTLISCRYRFQADGRLRRSMETGEFFAHVLLARLLNALRNSCYVDGDVRSINA